MKFLTFSTAAIFLSCGNVCCVKILVQRTLYWIVVGYDLTFGKQGVYLQLTDLSIASTGDVDQSCWLTLVCRYKFHVVQMQTGYVLLLIRNSTRHKPPIFLMQYINPLLLLLYCPHVGHLCNRINLVVFTQHPQATTLPDAAHPCNFLFFVSTIKFFSHKITIQLDTRLVTLFMCIN